MHNDNGGYGQQQRSYNNDNFSQPMNFHINGGGGGSIGGIPGTDSAGMGLAGSSYLRGLNNKQFSDSKDEDNWDDESKESDADDYADCEERGEFIFENRARYKG